MNSAKHQLANLDKKISRAILFIIFPGATISACFGTTLALRVFHAHNKEWTTESIAIAVATMLIVFLMLGGSYVFAKRRRANRTEQ
jgi:hypothetical protein